MQLPNLTIVTVIVIMLYGVLGWSWNMLFKYFIVIRMYGMCKGGNLEQMGWVEAMTVGQELVMNPLEWTILI